MGFVSDAWICLPIAVAVICGGLGFPVLLEIRRRPRSPRNWSLHTKMTTVMTALLLFTGMVFTTVNEWTNRGTLARLGVRNRLLAGFFHSAMTRTAGFNNLDIPSCDPALYSGPTC